MEALVYVVVLGTVVIDSAHLVAKHHTALHLAVDRIQDTSYPHDYVAWVQ